MNTKEHFPLLDIFRIIICVMVFLFHAVIHKFWIIKQDSFLYPNLATGALYMDAFFILSGFLLYYLYSDKLQNLSIQTIKDFYLKRIKRIYPHYILSTIIISIMAGVVWWAVPIEVFCLQGFFPSLFNKMGNGGTWFISCLMVCYLLFPFLIDLIKQIRKEILVIILLYFTMIYFNCLIIDLKIKWVALYIHPIYRLLEFVIGMIVGKLFCTKPRLDSIKASIISIIGFVLLFGLVPVLYKSNFINHIKFAQNYPLYCVLTIPIFSGLIYSLASIKNKFIDIIAQNKLIKLFSALTFPFFIWQGVAQILTRIVVKNYLLDEYPFMLYFVITLLLSIILYMMIDVGLKYFTRVFK
ncbi:acyltransferase [bacterium]|nr:acyltransferase [bacterium]